jgi:hypothetical protein
LLAGSFAGAAGEGNSADADAAAAWKKPRRLGPDRLKRLLNGISDPLVDYIPDAAALKLPPDPVVIAFALHLAMR